MITRLIYASRVADTFNASDVRAILNSSIKNNTPVDITGMLYFGENNFFQCLEGAQAEVDRIYDKIIPDARHRDCQVISYDRVEEHLFKNWNMAYLDSQDENVKKLLDKYSVNGKFSVYNLSKEQAQELITDFSAALAESKRASF